MFVIPAPGLAIRDPELMDLIPAEGREVQESPYWVRRLRDGDVTTVETASADTTTRSVKK